MLYVHGLGHYYPENIIDNRFLEDLDIGTSNEWIMERVGIKTRYTSLPLDFIRSSRNKDPWETRRQASLKHHMFAVKAAQMALERAKLNPSDIGMVVCDQGGGEYWTPAVANLVAAELGINGLAYDCGTACSTFGLQMHLLNCMRPEKTPDYILVALSSPISWITNYNDRNTAVLFGDAGAAAVVSLKRPGRMKMENSIAGNESSQWDKIQSPKAGHFMLDGAEVQKFAIKKTISISKEIIGNSDTWGDRYFVGHPANVRMLEGICRILGVHNDKHLRSVVDRGNCGQSSAPAVLSENWDLFKTGEEIVVSVVGGGLGWSSLRMQVVT